MAGKDVGSGGTAQNTTSQSVEIFDVTDELTFAIRSHWRATYTYCPYVEPMYLMQMATPIRLTAKIDIATPGDASVANPHGNPMKENPEIVEI